MTPQSFYAVLNPRRLARFWLPEHSQVRNVAVLVAGNVLKLGLGVGTSALIFRWLGPGDAGRLALVLGIVGLMSIMQCPKCSLPKESYFFTGPYPAPYCFGWVANVGGPEPKRAPNMAIPLIRLAASPSRTKTLHLPATPHNGWPSARL